MLRVSVSSILTSRCRGTSSI